MAISSLAKVQKGFTMTISSTLLNFIILSQHLAHFCIIPFLPHFANIYLMQSWADCYWIIKLILYLSCFPYFYPNCFGVPTFQSRVKSRFGDEIRIFRTFNFKLDFSFSQIESTLYNWCCTSWNNFLNIFWVDLTNLE